jgi:hypothetical protein
MVSVMLRHPEGVRSIQWANGARTLGPNAILPKALHSGSSTSSPHCGHPHTCPGNHHEDCRRSSGAEGVARSRGDICGRGREGSLSDEGAHWEDRSGLWERRVHCAGSTAAVSRCHIAVVAFFAIFEFAVTTRWRRFLHSDWKRERGGGCWKWNWRFRCRNVLEPERRGSLLSREGFRWQCGWNNRVLHSDDDRRRHCFLGRRNHRF